MTGTGMPETRSPPSGVVLLALYEGERFLAAQLDSIAAQEVPWRLVVSDDGSTDAGPGIVRGFADAHPGRVTLTRGPGQGAAANFRALLAGVPEAAGWAALADQDDVWRPGKLARALAALAAVPAGQPALYCSRVTLCDPALRPIGASRPPYPPSFRHALVQNLVQGNTAVLNPAALALVRAAEPLTPPVVMHDWWLYQLVTGAGGTVILDPAETVLYRQHEGNVVGGNAGPRARLESFTRMLGGGHRAWGAQTLAALTPVRHLLTDENRRVLDAFTALHHGEMADRLVAMARGGFRRQGPVSQAALWLAAALGRL